MPEATKQLTVSCVICFHREGLLAHTTLHSIGRARAFAEAEGINVQCVITLDNHDETTERIVMAHPVIRGGDIVDIVNYGDAGLSRNHAISRSSGEYIIIADGDDYCSDNFISVFTKQAALDEHSALFPEYLFVFGLVTFYMKMGGPEGFHRNVYALFSDSFYSSRVAAHREVFEQVPFSACGKGFGYEDWHWACEAMAQGIRLRPAPGVVLFYRRRHNSRLEEHTQGKTIIPRSKFFETLPLPSEGLPVAHLSIPAPALSPKALARDVLLTCLEYLPTFLANPVHAKLKAVFGPGRFSGYPPVIQSALLEVATVDDMLHPRILPSAFPNSPHYDLLPGKVYAVIWHELQSHTFDVVYLIGQICADEASLMTINYIASMQGAGKRVLCIIMEAAQSDFGQIPDGVTVLCFGRVTSCLAHQQKQNVLVRLLVQLMPPVIHAINEWFSFELMGIYGEALKSQSRMYVSIFPDFQDTQNIHFGTEAQYLRDLSAHCTRIITDNFVTSRGWHNRLGLPLDLFQAVYSVVRLPCSLQMDERCERRVLWAGRLDKGKRLDILLAIAQELPNVSFDVYGQTVLDKDSIVSELKRQPNVTLCGGYRNFYELPFQQYAALLCTTQCQGLPNVLLEAAACGLPLIAPDCGGISDFVSNETGWLLASHTDVDAYVRAVQAVLVDPAEAGKRVQRAQQLLARRHSPEIFSATLLQAYGLSPSHE